MRRSPTPSPQTSARQRARRLVPRRSGDSSSNRRLISASRGTSDWSAATWPSSVSSEQGGPTIGGMCNPAQQAFVFERIGNSGHVAGAEAERVGQGLHLGRALAVQRFEHAQPWVGEPALRARIEPLQEQLREPGRQLEQLAMGNVGRGDCYVTTVRRWSGVTSMLMRPGYRISEPRDCVVSDTYIWYYYAVPLYQEAHHDHNHDHTPPRHRHLGVRPQPLRRLFKVRHLGLTNVRGRFNGVDAWLEVGDDLASTQFGATIDIATIDTNQADRDAHLLSTDFFSAEQHPTMTFASTAIRDLGSDEYEADGDLTINGITKPVTLAVEFTGADDHPGDGKLHSGFIATAQVCATTSASTSTCRSASTSSPSARRSTSRSTSSSPRHEA